MKDTSHHDAKFAKMSFASVYPLYINKIERINQPKVSKYISVEKNQFELV